MARIAIIGAGAIGCALGALLARAGQDVTLIGRPSQVAAIRSGGLHVDGVLGTFTIPVAAAEALAFRPDIALLAVKTQDVVTAVEASRALLDGVPIVTLQNGVHSDDMVAGILSPDQIVSAVVSLIATYLTPGTVTIVSPGDLLIGAPFTASDQDVQLAARILNLAIPTAVSQNIRGAHWLKLLINLNNALPAITNMSVQEVYADPYLSQLAIRLLREGLAVVRRAGIALAPLPDVSVGLIRLLGGLPVWLATRITVSNVRRRAADTPVLGSTLQSVRRGRPTEIAYLNGAIVELGGKVGVPTPLNGAVVAMVQRIEQTGQFWSAGAVREALASAGLRDRPAG